LIKSPVCPRIFGGKDAGRPIPVNLSVILSAFDFSLISRLSSMLLSSQALACLPVGRSIPVNLSVILSAFDFSLISILYSMLLSSQALACPPDFWLTNGRSVQKQFEFS